MRLRLRQKYITLIALVLLLLLIVCWKMEWRWLMATIPLVAVFVAFLPRK